MTIRRGRKQTCRLQLVKREHGFVRVRQELVVHMGLTFRSQCFIVTDTGSRLNAFQGAKCSSMQPRLFCVGQPLFMYTPTEVSIPKHDLEGQRLLTVAEAADFLKISRDSVIRKFHRRPGVLDLGCPEACHKRPYRVLRIPSSVLAAYMEEVRVA
jgi:hypothetical protein